MTYKACSAENQRSFDAEFATRISTADFRPFGPFYVPRRYIRMLFPRVYCRFCGKAIRLSKTFTKKMAARKRNSRTSIQELSSRLFRARCGSCHEEAFYTRCQIVDFPNEEPETFFRKVGD